MKNIKVLDVEHIAIDRPAFTKIADNDDLIAAMELSASFKEYVEDEKDYGFEIETDTIKFYIINDDVWQLNVNYCEATGKTFLVIDQYYNGEYRQDNYFIGWYYGKPNDDYNEFYIKDFAENPKIYGYEKAA